MSFPIKRKQLNEILATKDTTPPEKAKASVDKPVTDDTNDGDDPEGKVRLSCDVKQRNHKKLRMAAAERYTTLAQVVDDLIERNL